MKLSFLPFPNTERTESFYMLIGNISMGLFAIVRSQIREGNLTTYPHRIGDTRIEVSVKFLIFCLEIVIDLEMDEERCFESFFENTGQKMFGHIERLSMDTDDELGIRSLDMYEINPLLLILTLRRQILNGYAHKAEKLSGNVCDFFLHGNMF